MAILSCLLAKTLAKAGRRTANAEHLFPLPLRLVFQCTTYTVVELCLAGIPLLLRNKCLENKTEKECTRMCIVQTMIVTNEHSKKKPQEYPRALLRLTDCLKLLLQAFQERKIFMD